MGSELEERDADDRRWWRKGSFSFIPRGWVDISLTLYVFATGKIMHGEGRSVCVAKNLGLGFPDPTAAGLRLALVLLLQQGEDALYAQAHPHCRHLLPAEHAHQVVISAQIMQ